MTQRVGPFGATNGTGGTVQHGLVFERHDVGEDGPSTLNNLTLLHADARLRRKDDVDAGAELDETDALTALQRLTRSVVENDAAGEQSGDLLERNRPMLAFEHGEVLLIALSRSGVHRVEVFTFLVGDLAEYAADGSAVHMYVEDVEKDADALAAAFGRVEERHLGDLAIGR